MSDTFTPTTSAGVDQSQTAPMANGQSFQDSMLNDRPSTFVSPGPQSDAYPDAPAAMNTASNHPTTQGAKESLNQGPVAQSVKNEGAKTGNEFSGLANSRQQPQELANTGQPLTHYHSFFYTLLSWEQPRATSISFAASVLFIFASRYLPLLRWVFKVGYLAFGATALAEIVGKSVTGTGMAASLRPRKYYRIPKETLETFLDDVEQLVNFFVIEFQRILFAENVAATVAAFLSALVSYYLIKILPVWGLTLMTTCIIYLAPLIYVKNKEVIDGQLEHASNVVSAQTAQFKDVAGQRTSKGFESMKHYTGDYASRAQGLVGSARQKMPAVGTQSSKPSAVNENQFPAAPKSDPASETSPPTFTGGPAPVAVS